MHNKEIYIKTYDTSGNIKGFFYDFVFSQFTQSLNSGLGELQVTIPRKFDDFGLNDTIAKDYEIRLIVSDQDGTTTQYSGRVDEIVSSVSDKESVTLRCSGYVSELALNLLEGSSNSVRIEYSSQEIGSIIEDLIDKHRTSFSDAVVNYTGTSIGNTSKNITIKFFASYVLDAIKQVLSHADEDWCFYVDVDNNVVLKEISTTPDHYFVLGSDVSRLEIKDTNKQKRTKYLFYNGQTTDDPDVILKRYSDGSSDRRFEIVRDDRITDTTTSDEKGDRFVDTYKNGLQTVRARILDSNLGSGYDIESVSVGDTCKFLNVSTESPLPTNGVITTKTYNKDYIDIVVEDAEQFVARSLQESRSRLSLIEFNSELPSAYTT